MKKIDLKCPSCGARMKLSDDKSSATCPYCENSIVIQEEKNLKDECKRIEQLTYARESAKFKAANDIELHKKTRESHAKLATILIIIFIIGAAIAFNIIAVVSNYYALELIENPFECINVKFNGVDGSGKVEILDNGQCDYFKDINFSPAKNKALYEGQTVTISAISDIYRFEVSEKKFKVKGLSKFLTSLESLTDEVIEKVHEYSYNKLTNSAFSLSYEGDIVSLTPYKFYLYTNNSNKNYLYDVYSVEIKARSNKVFKKYVVAYYKDFLLLSNQELFSYSDLRHCGNLIKAGDPSAMSYLNYDYAGNLWGFETIEDFKSYLSANNDGSFEVTER